jgi:hypothetical protein
MGNTIWPKRYVAGTNPYPTADHGAYSSSVSDGTFTLTVDVVATPYSAISNPSANATINFDLRKYDTNNASIWYFEFLPNGKTLSFGGLSVASGALTYNHEGGSQASLSTTYNLFQMWTVDGTIINVRKVMGY